MHTKSILHSLSSPTDTRAHVTTAATSSAADWGLVLIRLTFGLLMAGHGAQKLFGLFGVAA